MLSAYGISDAGLVRKGNEDGFICSDALRLYAVADGMGGHLAGEVASRLALEALEESIREGGRPAGDGAGERLRDAILLANRRVFRSSETRPDYAGMGTTVTAVLAVGGRVAFAHVGDSRLYLLAGGDFRQVTRDDSWVATVLAQDPRFTPADLAHHPMRHVLTSVIGAREHVEVQYGEMPLQGEQTFLLCTDGLHGLVDDVSMRRILESGTTIEAMGRALIEGALEKGGHDNVTAVLIRHRSEP